MAINLKIESNKVDAEFCRIATELMNLWILKAENSLYRITEVEFYFNNDSHEDKFTHCHNLQKSVGRWYFHGSGIDITFGNSESYGGILIRAIYNIETKEYIYGPLNTVAELLRNLPEVYYSMFSIGLIQDENKRLEFEKPISAPRVGLNQITDRKMYHKFYRFLVMPKQKHAEKSRIAEAMKEQNYSIEEIKTIWG